MRTDGTDIRDAEADQGADTRENVPLSSRQSAPRSQRGEVVVASAAPRLTHEGLAAEAYMTRLGVNTSLLEVGSLAAAVGRLAAGAADVAFLPIESTLAGSLNEVYDLLRETDAHIVGEQFWPVDLCLAGPSQVPMNTLRRVLADASSIAWCSAFLQGLPQVRAVPCVDAVQAARLAAEVDNPYQAAICSVEAATAHGLTILRRGIGNEPELLVRYVAIARSPAVLAAGADAKTSLILSVPDEDGALLRCLQVFAEQRISLTKVESRARSDRPGEYMLFVDLRGNSGEPSVATALDRLRASVTYLKVLGSYAIAPAVA